MNTQSIKNGFQFSELDEKFRIYSDMVDFPVSEDPVYLKESIGAVCTSGTAFIQVFDIRFKIMPEVIVTLLPWQLVSIKEVSEDFRMTFFRVSQVLFMDCLSGLWRPRPDFFFYMRRHIVSQPTEGNIGRFLNFCDLLEYRTNYGFSIGYRESIMQLLRVYYWDVYAFYINDCTHKLTKYTHKEELACRFMQMIVEDHSPAKDVAYYAARLNVSSKYLTNVTRSISGRSARDWIVFYMILEIKTLLLEPSMDLKSIVGRVNFPDLPTLCRFFRHYTGFTPSKYRENAHF